METLEDGGFSNLATVLKALIGDAVSPVGTIIDFAGASIPDGYLECDGSAVSRTTYAALFAVLGTTWGAGDGSTTFNLPNLGGRVAIGKGSRSVGATGGSETHALTPAETAMKNHSHTVPAHAHGLNSHKHSVGAHKHTVPQHGHGNNISFTVVNNGSHRHAPQDYWGGCGGAGGNRNAWAATGDGGGLDNILNDRGYSTYAGSHGHTLTKSGGVSDKAAFDTNNSTAFDSGAASGNTANSSELTSGGQTEANGSAHNIMQPYAVVRKLIRAL